MRWVKVEDVGETEFLIDEVVDKFRFISENEKMTSKAKKPATGRPLLLGITKASLSTDSFSRGPRGIFASHMYSVPPTRCPPQPLRPQELLHLV